MPANSGVSFTLKVGRSAWLAVIKKPAGSAISSTSLSGKGVKVLWSTVNTTTAPAENELIKDLTIKNDVVSFTAGSKAGNAVIALYSNASCTGDILWSWHIWICDDIKDQTYNGHTWLDRNLGALSATAGDPLSLGLLYQFGRKDPFRGGAVIDAQTSIVTSGAEWPTPEKVTSSPEAHAIANPMKLLLRQNTTTDDWLAADVASQNNAIWDTNDKKTMHDPCPRGYRVPKRYAWNTGHTAGTAFLTTSNFTYDSTTLCRTYKSGNITVVYPIAGCLSASGVLTNVGSTGYYRTANQGTSNLEQADVLEITSSSINTQKGNFRSSAYSVRCVKE